MSSRLEREHWRAAWFGCALAAVLTRSHLMRAPTCERPEPVGAQIRLPWSRTRESLQDFSSPPASQVAAAMRRDEVGARALAPTRHGHHVVSLQRVARRGRLAAPVAARGVG